MSILRTLCCLASLILGVMGASCGHSDEKVSLRVKPRAYTAADYPDVYKHWTREADDFSLGRMSTVLHVTATFESWEFRRAYVVRYARDHSMSVEDREAMWQASRKDAETYHRFFVTLVGQDYRESDLTHRLSAWRVLLLDDNGRATLPEEVEKVKKTRQVDRLYFPSISPFRQTVRISFRANEKGRPSVPKGAKYVLLRFAGPAGKVDLRWDFDGGDA